VFSFFAVAFLAARSAWVDSDYPSSVSCGVTVPVVQCDPSDATANNACRDMCHYGGCRGGACTAPGLSAADGAVIAGVSLARSEGKKWACRQCAHGVELCFFLTGDLVV
jgi:hypothetical protein